MKVHEKEKCLSTVDIDLSTVNGYESIMALTDDRDDHLTIVIHNIELPDNGIMIEYRYGIISDLREHRQIFHHNSKIIHIDMEESDIHARYDKSGKLRCKHKNKHRLPKRLYASFDAYMQHELERILDLLYL